MTSAIKRGALIVFEGCDRSGKTTQVTRLVERLNNGGKPAIMMRFPDRTSSIGGVINSYLGCKKELDDHVVHLLFSANRWEVEREIVNTIKSGTTICIDRYAYSGVAFSAAKDGLTIDWCKQPDVGLPRPDLVCFLDVSEEVAQQRADFGGERYEVTDFQRRVRANYDKLRDNTWVTVSADGTLEEVGEELFQVVSREVTRDKTELGRLWVEEGDMEVASTSSQTDSD